MQVCRVTGVQVQGCRCGGYLVGVEGLVLLLLGVEEEDLLLAARVVLQGHSLGGGGVTRWPTVQIWCS